MNNSFIAVVVDTERGLTHIAAGWEVAETEEALYKLAAVEVAHIVREVGHVAVMAHVELLVA